MTKESLKQSLKVAKMWSHRKNTYISHALRGKANYPYGPQTDSLDGAMLSVRTPHIIQNRTESMNIEYKSNKIDKHRTKFDGFTWKINEIRRTSMKSIENLKESMKSRSISFRFDENWWKWKDCDQHLGRSGNIVGILEKGYENRLILKQIKQSIQRNSIR